MGQVEFKDFLWEALLDPGAKVHDGRHRGKSRAAISDHAAGGGRLRGAQLRARDRGAEKRLPAGEIAPVKTETFEIDGLEPRGIRLARETREVSADTPYPAVAGRGAREDQAGLRRRADRRQFLGHRRRRGSGDRGRRRTMPKQNGKTPLARILGAVPRSACRRRSWASARCRRSRPCSSAPG